MSSVIFMILILPVSYLFVAEVVADRKRKAERRRVDAQMERWAEEVDREAQVPQ